MVSSLLRKGCDNPCLTCQMVAYKLKFQKQADCPNSYCRTTCHKIWSLWNRPLSPFAAFQKDNLGKCDVCFRAGFCSITECSAQNNMEKYIISKVVDNAKLTGFVDNSIIKKSLKKIMRDEKIDVKILSRKIKKQIKKNSKTLNFRKKIKGISKALRLLANVKSRKDLHQALGLVDKALRKVRKSTKAKKAIKKLTHNFADLFNSKKVKKIKKCSKNKKKC